MLLNRQDAKIAKKSNWIFCRAVLGCLGVLAVKGYPEGDRIMRRSIGHANYMG